MLILETFMLYLYTYMLCFYLHVKLLLDALKLLQVQNKGCEKDRNFHTSELARTCPTCVFMSVIKLMVYNPRVVDVHVPFKHIHVHQIKQQ